MSPPGHLHFPQLWQETLLQQWKWPPYGIVLLRVGWGEVVGGRVSFAALMGDVGFCVCFMPLHRVAFSVMRLSGGMFPPQLLIVAPIIVKTIPFTSPDPLP